MNGCVFAGSLPYAVEYISTSVLAMEKHVYKQQTKANANLPKRSKRNRTKESLRKERGERMSKITFLRMAGYIPHSATVREPILGLVWLGR